MTHLAKIENFIKQKMLKISQFTKEFKDFTVLALSTLNKRKQEKFFLASFIKNCERSLFVKDNVLYNQKLVRDFFSRGDKKIQKWE